MTWGAAASLFRHCWTIVWTAVARSSCAAEASTSFNTDSSLNHFASAGHCSLNRVSLNVYQPQLATTCLNQKQVCVDPRSSDHSDDVARSALRCWRKTSINSRYEVPAAIDWYLLPAPGLQQTGCTSLPITGCRATGQTDGYRTVTYRRSPQAAGSVNKTAAVRRNCKSPFTLCSQLYNGLHNRLYNRL